MECFPHIWQEVAFAAQGIQGFARDDIILLHSAYDSQQGVIHCDYLILFEQHDPEVFISFFMLSATIVRPQDVFA